MIYNRWTKFCVYILGMYTLGLIACDDDIDPVIEELSTERVFAPVELEARVRNQVDIELSWTANPEVEQYLIEFFQDSLLYVGDPVSTAVVEEVPVAGTIRYTESFAGETMYSARVRAIAAGQIESNWATVAIRTDPEQIFLDLPGENVQDNSATLLWEAGSEVTHLLVVPGNTLYQISEAQKAAGEALIEGLSGATDYTVTLYNDSQRRGTTYFSTLKEVNVTPADDLSLKIANAAEGDTLVLASGDYTIETINLTKSIVIEGQKWYDKPVVIGRFTFDASISSVTVKFLHLKADGESQAFNAVASSANIENLIIDECEISDYANNIIYNEGSGTYGTVIMRDSYIHDIPGGGGDGFDIRGGAIESLTVENTVFANGIRSFLRMQVAADVSFTNCTLYRACNYDNSNNSGFFRIAEGSLTVSKCLFVETGVVSADGNYGNWARVGNIGEEVSTTYSDNYYYNCIAIWEGAITNPSEAGAAEADPGFVDAVNGDFTITNQTLLDDEVGASLR